MQSADMSIGDKYNIVWCVCVWARVSEWVSVCVCVCVYVCVAKQSGIRHCTYMLPAAFQEVSVAGQ